MPLTPGTRIGVYEVTGSLGAGGMGEVYRARDTKLDRHVALKVLPEAFTQDPDRLARFEREAKVLASLNHPNIGSIYGLEEAEPSTASSGLTGSGPFDSAQGRQGGGKFRALVLELVEGPTLADRIARGPIPFDDALPIAKQIAEALEAAHEAGVIHRDLKPANIKVKDDGTVKVLDFGLAKAFQPDATDPNPSASPTISLTAAATQAGMIVGTAAYMSPEQAKGLPVDKRADVWAFGAVLFEMLTGRKAFAGDGVSDTMAAVLRAEPAWALLPAVSPRVRELLHRCLQKDARNRWHDIADVRIVLEEAQSGSANVMSLPEPTRLSWAFGMALISAGVVGGYVVATLTGDPAPPTTTTAEAPSIVGTINLPESTRLASGTAAIGFDSPLLTLSPDGRWMVFVGRHDGGSRLYRRRLDAFEDAEPIPGTEGATYAFFSPDGAAIGFLTANRLNRVSLNGDDLRTLAAARTAVRATWASNGWIYFHDNQGTGRLRRVRAEGDGSVEDLGAMTAAVTDVLPDGRHVLATRLADSIHGDYASIVVVNLDTAEETALSLSGYDARWLPTGHLLFGRGGNILAVPFDLDTRTVRGDAVTLVRNAAMDALFGHVQVAVSASGTLAYVPGADRSIGRIIAVDRERGSERPLSLPPGKYGVLDLSPDDRQLAVHVSDVSDYVLLVDLERDEARKVIGSDGFGWPVWSHDGGSLVFSSGFLRLQDAAATMLRFHALDDTAARAPIEALGSSNVTAWHPTEPVLAMGRGPIAVGFLPLDAPSSIEWLDQPPASRWGLVFSPDGDSTAYQSDESGQFEIWVGSFPASRVRQLSLSGGNEPVWCPCDEIFFRRGNEWLSARISPGDELTWETPQSVFAVEDFLDTPGRSYDVSSDGQWLYVVQRVEPAVNDKIRVVGNWFEELKARVPVP